MDSYTSKFATMFDDVVQVREEKYPRERFVFRNREDMPTSTICNSGRANLAQGSNDLNFEKWSTYYQSYLAKYEFIYSSMVHNSMKVIRVADGNDSNNITTASEINSFNSIDTSINSKTSDDIQSSNQVNDPNKNESDWDFMNEELGELGLEEKSPKRQEQ